MRAVNERRKGMNDELRRKFIAARAKVIARAREEAKKEGTSLNYLIFGKGSTWRIKYGKR